MAKSDEAGDFRAAFDALKDKARDAKEGIRESGRRFRVSGVRFAWWSDRTLSLPAAHR